MRWMWETDSSNSMNDWQFTKVEATEGKQLNEGSRNGEFCFNDTDYKISNYQGVCFNLANWSPNLQFRVEIGAKHKIVDGKMIFKITSLNKLTDGKKVKQERSHDSD